MPPPKRLRAAPGASSIQVADITPESMRVMVSTGEVERLNVGQLRDYLQLQGIATSGKKGDLLERVRALYTA